MSPTNAIVITRRPRSLCQKRIITITESMKNTKEHQSRYKRFVRTPPKSFFKELFLGDTILT